MTDLKFALRQLLKNPGYAAIAVITLALGIGFVTTLFTMINGVAFGQLPFENAKRIVSIGVPATQFDEFARQQKICEPFAFAQPKAANVRAGNFVSRYSAAVVSANFLDVLRARPVLGRGFSPEDGLAGADPVALVGHTIWEREFEKSPSAVGCNVKIDGKIHTVVGVMPDGFGFPFNQEIWVARRADEPVNGGFVFGRLKQGVSTRSAATQFTVLSQNLAQAAGKVVKQGAAPFVWDADAKPDAKDANQFAPVEVIPFAERGIKDALRLILSAVLGATFLVLLLACANVANLILARAVDRRREMAIRTAMGASRAHLIRGMLAESLVMSVLGAVGGLAVASGGTRVIWNYMMRERPLTGGAPFWIHFNVDGRVFLFVAAVAMLATLVTGLAPALQVSRVDPNDALKEGGGAGRRVSRFTRLLVNAQMAVSVCLVTVAGLFVTVLLAFNQKSLPYDPTSILTARISLDGSRYDNPAVRAQFFGDLITRLNTEPGVDAAALDSSESLRMVDRPGIEFEGANYANANGRPRSVVESVSANFLDGFGVGLLNGRTFSISDDGKSPPIAVVNAAFANQFGRETDVVGRRFRFAGSESAPWITIVGVVPDLGSMKAGEVSRGPVIYRPLEQSGDRAMTILLRGGGDISRFGTVIRREVAALDPELPVARLQTVEEIIEMERVGMNSFATLFVVCGLGALVLASIGIYGVISFGVKQRTREFGVRMAVGANRGMFTRMVMVQGVKQLSIGLGIGVVLAVGAAAVLSAIFLNFGGSSHDVWIYAGASGLLALVAGTALLIPARRAARVDPMEALRNE